jgi:hypothetical protein
MMSGTFLIELEYSVRETDETFIAHRLIGGYDREKRSYESRQGRPNFLHPSLTGLGDQWERFPAMNRWAKNTMSASRTNRL